MRDLLPELPPNIPVLDDPVKLRELCRELLETIDLFRQAIEQGEPIGPETLALTALYIHCITPLVAEGDAHGRGTDDSDPVSGTQLAGTDHATGQHLSE